VSSSAGKALFLTGMDFPQDERQERYSDILAMLMEVGGITPPTSLNTGPGNNWESASSTTPKPTASGKGGPKKSKKTWEASENVNQAASIQQSAAPPPPRPQGYRGRARGRGHGKGRGRGGPPA
jgi:hypothetical protein